MGCFSSRSGSMGEEEADRDNTEIQDFLSPSEMDIVSHTWQIVKEDMPGTGIYMFTRLFELQGDFKKFFKRLMTQTETGEYDFDWNKLGNHASIVMSALDNCVDSLGDSTALSARLTQLGANHRGFKVKPEMFPLMWPAVRDALRQALAGKFTVETELAWKHVFDYIVCKLATGMRQSPNKLPPPAAANGVVISLTS